MSLGGVIGIDLGSQNCVISQAKRGGIETVLNESSKRKTANLVSFQQSQRFIGEQAVPIAKSNFKNTVRSISNLVGLEYDSKAAQKELSFLPNKEKFFKLESGYIGMKLSYNDTEVEFSCEQVCAMLINKLRDGASDIVLSVPYFWSQTRRKCLLDACFIAGVKPLNLLNSTTASALSYGIYKSARNEFSEDKTLVMFVDVGFSKTEVSIVEFVQGELRVRGTTYDEQLGGRDFDLVLYEKFRQEFLEKTKLDVAKNQKSVMKLMEVCEKAKQTLTPAGVAFAKVNVEYLMEETDFRSQLMTEDFLELTAPLVERIGEVVQACLKKCNLESKDLAFVELVGGASRPRNVREAIEKATSKPVSTTLNLDESVSRGCALNSAMLSAQFRVKEFAVFDVTDDDSAVKVSWTAKDKDDEGTEAEIISSGTSYPCKKRLTFKRTTTFDLVAKKKDGQKLVSYKIVLPEKESKEVPVIRCDFAMNGTGMFDIKSADLMTKIEEPVVEEPKKTAKEAKKEKKEDEDKKENDKTEPEDAEKLKKEGEEKTPDPEEKKEEPKQPEKKTARFTKSPLAVEKQFFYGLNTKTLEEFKTLENTYSEQDKIIAQTAESKNALESYVYSYRDKLDLSLKEFVNETEAETFKAKLQSLEDWLYDEGYDETKEMYDAKLKECKQIGDKLDSRQSEYETRPGAVEDQRNLIKKIKAVINSTEEMFDHITEEDRNKVRTVIQETEDWMDKQIKKQEQLPKNEDPVITTNMIQAKTLQLRTVGLPVINKPRPKPEPVPEVKKDVAMDEEKGKDAAAAPPTENGADEPKKEEPEMDVD